jgi:hypothetical protein
MFSHTRLHRRVGLLSLMAAVGLTSSGCGFIWDDGPAEVTRDFWNAARDGNSEMVDALSVNDHGADFDLQDADSEIRSISIGDTEIDGDEAEVLTVIEGSNDDVEMTIEFKTALVKRDGDWYVELEETGGRLIGAFVGEMVSHFGEEFGAAMSEMADELAEGMDELGEALQEAAEDMRERREEERRERNRRDNR